MTHTNISDLKTKQNVKGTDPSSSSNYTAVKWGKTRRTWDRGMGRKHKGGGGNIKGILVGM